MAYVEVFSLSRRKMLLSGSRPTQDARGSRGDAAGGQTRVLEMLDEEEAGGFRTRRRLCRCGREQANRRWFGTLSSGVAFI